MRSHDHRGPVPRLPVWIKIGVVMTALVIAIDGCGTNGDTYSPTSSAPVAGAIGTDCDLADVGSGSATDPSHGGVSQPACKPQHYSTRIRGLGSSPTDAMLAKVNPKELLWAVIKGQHQDNRGYLWPILC